MKTRLCNIRAFTILLVVAFCGVSTDSSSSINTFGDLSRSLSDDPSTLFPIKKDPDSPWPQLSVDLPLRHPEYEQFIAKVVDVTTGIPSTLKDINRTFLAVENAHVIKIHHLHPGHKYSISVMGKKLESAEFIKEESLLMDPRAPSFNLTTDMIVHETNITLKTVKQDKAVQDVFQIEYSQLEPEHEYPMLEIVDIPEQKELEIYIGMLNPGRDYRVRVVAIRDGVRSQPWNGVLSTKPTAPTNLKPTDLPPNCVNLTWNLDSESGTDGFEIEYGTKGGEHVNKLTVAGESRSSLLCDSVQPGKLFRFAVATRKGSVVSSSAVVEHNIRPLAPLDFKAKPDITKGKYRIIADLPSTSNYENCQLTVISDTLSPLESTANVERKKTYTSCTFFVPLTPGERYEFSVSTSANGVSSTKLQKSIVLGPAFDMKGFGLNMQESKSGLELQWPQSEVFMSRMKDLWSKVVGTASILQMRVAPLGDRTKTKERTRQFESDPSKNQPITVAGLHQGACYQVQIYTVTKSGIVSESRYNESVRMAAPLVVVSLENVTHTSGTLMIQTGNTTDPSKNETIPDCQLSISVMDMHSMVVFDRRIPLTSLMGPIELNGLRPFHKYTVNSQVICGLTTSVCPSSTRTMKQLSFSTRQDRPGPVQGLGVKALNPYSVQLSWLPPALPNGILTHYVVSVQPSDPNQEPWSVNVPLTNQRDDHTIDTVVDALTGGEGYRFEVRAVTEAGPGDPPSNKDVTTVTMPIMAPPRPASTLDVIVESITSQTITVRYTTQLFDDKHGRITKSAMIVAEVTEDGRVSETWLYSDNKTYTWAEVQRFDVWPAYTATINDVPRTTKMAPTRVISEILGSNPNCADLPGDAICNGPLKPGKQYKFKMRIFTAPNLWTDTDYTPVVQTESLPAGLSLKAIVLYLSAVVLFGVLCVVCLALWSRTKAKRNPSFSENSKESQWAALKMIMAERAADCLAKLGLDGAPNCENVHANVSPTQPNTPQNNLQQPGFGHHRRCRSLRERTGVDHRLERLPSGPAIHRTPLYTVMAGTNTNKSRPVRIPDFPEHVRLMSADSDFRFSEEYEQLKNVGVGQSYSAAELAVNRVKNRFTNILPYDHSRVKLINVEDEEGADYINANYMPGFSSRREFIAAQGPLPSTRDQFWQMAWEQQCPAIIALTKCVEKGRDKCHQYWPDAEHMSVLYGDIEVTLMSETQYEEFTVRELRLCNLAENSAPRHIIHLHYMAWPDFGVPDHPQGIVRFSRLFRSKLPHSQHNKPTIVHCSAGVGRSGTFMAMDRLCQTMTLDRPIDVFGIVHEMRMERCHMVQNEQQYIFIHHCLNFVLQSGLLAEWSCPSIQVASTDWDMEMDTSPQVQIHQNAAFEDDEGIAESGF